MYIIQLREKNFSPQHRSLKYFDQSLYKNFPVLNDSNDYKEHRLAPSPIASSFPPTPAVSLITSSQIKDGRPYSSQSLLQL